MDFFAAQDKARRTSRWLVLWFALAVLVIVAAVDAVITITVHVATQTPIPALPLGFHAGSMIAVLLVVGIGALVRIVQLAKGGEAVAEMVGARLLEPGTRDLHERRLLNVVEEMAIASGLTVPRVYVLDKERGINAFAAGYSPNEAIIAVNRGTLTQLTRDQLQGVIAHEFSHILHGDMRLNIRLLGWLSGLLGIFVMGRLLIRLGFEADDLRALVPALLVGGALCAVGYLGVLLGRMIQAAVSRQREFLADASAVRYTRNPDGIGGALRRIGAWFEGTLIDHPNGETLSYLCFGATVEQMVDGWFATHPPVLERVRRIYGREMDVIETEPPPPAAEEIAALEAAAGFAAQAGARRRGARSRLAPDSVIAAVARVTPQQMEQARAFHNGLDDRITGALREAGGAQLVVAICLLLLEPAQRKRQLQFLQRELAPADFRRLVELIVPIEALGEARQVELADLAVPALRTLEAAARTQFLDRMRRLVLVDNTLSLPELLLYILIEYRLIQRVTIERARLLQALPQLADAASVVLSALAHAATRDTPLAFEQARGQIGARCPQLALMAAAAVGPSQVRAALERLLFLTPMDKPLLIRAAVAAITHDGVVSARENLLLRTLCATLDVPLPPLEADLAA
jgi:Zn-dependent protease with chaperone function